MTPPRRQRTDSSPTSSSGSLSTNATIATFSVVVVIILYLIRQQRRKRWSKNYKQEYVSRKDGGRGGYSDNIVDEAELEMHKIMDNYKD